MDARASDSLSLLARCLLSPPFAFPSIPSSSCRETLQRGERMCARRKNRRRCPSSFSLCFSNCQFLCHPLCIFELRRRAFKSPRDSLLVASKRTYIYRERIRDVRASPAHIRFSSFFIPSRIFCERLCGYLPFGRFVARGFSKALILIGPARRLTIPSVYNRLFHGRAIGSLCKAST